MLKSSAMSVCRVWYLSEENGQWQPVLLLALTVLVIWRGKDNPLHDERNFEISDQGTYGTAGFMGTQETKRDVAGRPWNGAYKGDYSEGSCLMEIY